MAPPVADTRFVMSSDGTYIVGTDAQPGTYKSSPTHALSYPYCTWERLSNLTGTLDGTIAIENAPGQTSVTIERSDVAFKTNGCKPWERVG